MKSQFKTEMNFMEEGVYLLKIELENIRCFGEKAMLDLSNEKSKWKNWTIIIGNNGVGKTTLLQAISSLNQTELTDESEVWVESFNINFIGEAFNGSFYSNSKRTFFIKAITTLSSNLDYDISFSLGKSISETRKTNFKYAELKMYGYGATRFISRNKITPASSRNFATLFDDDMKLINAEEWLLQLDYSAKSSSYNETRKFIIKRRDIVKEVLLELLPDITAIRFTEPTKENLKTTVEFQTPYGWVTIHQLSLGYKTMVAWMVDLAARLFERYLNSDNPLAEPAIVLVDEIDLHMHPKWQRKIFDYLSEKFPKTQFIVTTHSPLIVQSAPKDANIVLLRREGDHVVIDNDIQSVHNWRIDQILNSDLFGNISQLPEEEEAWMEERTQLIQKGKLNETEQQRLDELNKKSDELPTADNQRDIEAMQIIREAAEYLKSKKTNTPA